MQGKRTLTISIALVMLLVTTGWAAQVKVSQPIQMTSSSYYERGQSVVFDGADYWMFYGRSATCTDPYSSGDPDVYDYVLYYKKASTVADLATATATQVLVAGR